MELPGAFDRLRGERVWVAWADEGGRKVPKSPRGGNAKTNDPSTWGTYAEAAAAASRNGYAGVGLMLTDGYIGVDLDGAVEDGAIADWAQEIIDHFGSYAELSPSGTGVHVVAWADPESVGPVGRADHSAGIEAYNHGRYFTVTGECVNSAPIVDATQDVPTFIERYFRGESPEEAVRRRVGRLARDQAKRMANRTMAENCARDGVRYARVPVGTETCGFCIMLASRGFVYTTPEAAAHAHDGCDCKVVPGFPGMEVEGYDPDSMYGLYAEARSRAAHPTDSEISREIERALAERAGGAIAASPTFLNSSTELFRRMEKIEPIEGYYDVKAHSDGYSLFYTDADDDAEYELTAKDIAASLRDDPSYDGGAIRLVACEAGRHPDGIAQQLADEMGVDVLAPDQMVYVDFDGGYRLAEDNRRNRQIIEGIITETGKWVVFSPSREVGGDTS